MVNRKLFLFWIIFLILLISIVSASEIGYIYRQASEIDFNILGVFNEINLSYNLINEKDLPDNFSDYKIIFVGNERFRKASKIPVGNTPSIVMNYYHGNLWDLTDRDGVSKLASNSPLNIEKDRQIIQVYNQARYFLGRASVPYYYLSDKNKNPKMQTIARTYTGGEYSFGDVISYSNSGAETCFFGIIETDYWTAEAREIFKDCVNFAMSGSGNTTPEKPECYIDENCLFTECDYLDGCYGEDYYDYFDVKNNCLEGMCEENLCEIFNVSDYDERCIGYPSYIHDIGLIDFNNSVGKIRIEYTNSTDILENPAKLMCNEEYKLGINVKNFGDYYENVSFDGRIGDLMFNHNPKNNFAPEDSILKTKTINFTLEQGNYNITVEAIISFDDFPENNFGLREIEVVC